MRSVPGPGDGVNVGLSWWHSVGGHLSGGREFIEFFPWTFLASATGKDRNSETVKDTSQGWRWTRAFSSLLSHPACYTDRGVSFLERRRVESGTGHCASSHLPWSGAAPPCGSKVTVRLAPPGGSEPGWGNCEWSLLQWDHGHDSMEPWEVLTEDPLESSLLPQMPTCLSLRGKAGLHLVTETPT